MRIYALILLTMLPAIAGCSSTKETRAGDATVRVTERFTGFDLFAAPKRIYTIELPRVSISEVGDHRFQVRGLSVPVTPNQLFMAYPIFGHLSIGPYREAWGDASLRVEFADTTGQILFAHTVQFSTAQFMSDSAYTRPNFSYHLDYRAPESHLSKTIRTLTDYDVRLTVETPTRQPGHFVRLRGEAFDFFGDRRFQNQPRSGAGE